MPPICHCDQWFAINKVVSFGCRLVETQNISLKGYFLSLIIEKVSLFDFLDLQSILFEAHFLAVLL